jgi:hypothetical protein
MTILLLSLGIRVVSAQITERNLTSDPYGY